MTQLNRTTLLAAVEQSPQAAAAHDRAGWVGLFVEDGRVEDPVGAKPHVGHDRIGRFYDTFIGPRDIKFHRDLDIVFDTVVVRDLELEVAMGSDVTMFIPAFLRYDLREVNGEWKIDALRAYWELPAMVLQFLRSGARAAAPSVRLTRGLLGNQGVAGAAGFVAGFRRAGARHKRSVDAFLRAVAQGDRHRAGGPLSPSAAITLGDSEELDLQEFARQLHGATCTKMKSAGSTVAASLSSDHGRGVLFADVAWRGGEIRRIRYFPA